MDWENFNQVELILDKYNIKYLVDIPLYTQDVISIEKIEKALRITTIFQSKMV